MGPMDAVQTVVGVAGLPGDAAFAVAAEAILTYSACDAY